MRAGSLRHEIIIQRYAESIDDFGGVTKDWIDLLTTRASIKPISAKDIVSGAVQINETSHSVFMRYQTDIKPNDRIIFKGRIFDITSVINREEKNITIELLCKEIF